jgi:hypothetical protein
MTEKRSTNLTGASDGESLDEEALALALARLRPAPAAWVQAAKELPALRAQLDSLVARAEADAEFRAAVERDLGRALQESGLTPDPALLRALRAQLASD